MWRCPRCETVNEDEEKQCYICECDITVFMDIKKKTYHQYLPDSNFVLNEAVSELYPKKEERTFQPEKKKPWKKNKKALYFAQTPQKNTPPTSKKTLGGQKTP